MLESQELGNWKLSMKLSGQDCTYTTLVSLMNNLQSPWGVSNVMKEILIH